VTASPLDRYADHFERLRSLPPDARAAALDALSLDAGEREQLARLLAADADEDPLEAAIAASAARLHRGEEWRLGAWRLLREIGAGGMGTVFLAERDDGSFVQQVAIKLLRGFPTQDGMRRLRQERRILATLDHPHIARLLDGGESDDGQPWLAIEYVDGVGLLEHVRTTGATCDQRLALFRAMLDAVEHAHQRLVIHRDLKPANVLVTQQGVVKLLDFGIARLVETDDSARRETSTRVFSQGYASPEQRAGAPITTASDIYSLGVLVREMLTGQRDDRGEGEPSVPPLALDVELAGVIAKACAERPQDRYAGAGALREDIDRYREGRPVLAAALTRRRRLAKFVARHQLAVALALAALVTLAGFVVGLERERQHARAAQAEAQVALAASERDAATARASLEFLTAAFTAASPDQAMSRQVSVRDLLDAARAQLDSHSAGHAELRQAMQRLLASLYNALGEVPIALDLMQRGVAGVEPRDGAEALRLAHDYDELASLLGQRFDGAGALAAAEQGAAWRTRYAPDDPLERMRSLQTLAMAHHRNGDNDRAVALLREAMALAKARDVHDGDALIQTTATLASLLGARSECEEALDVIAEGWQQGAGRATDSPDRVLLMRAEASALSACGRLDEAEGRLREAMVVQERVVGPGGARMMLLANDLALVLNDLGRYQEAVQMLARSEVLTAEADLGPADAAISLGNRGGLLENAGDYPGALAAFAAARERLDAGGVEADADVRRRIERSEARTIGIAGRHAEARRRLEGLRERAARLDGLESAEYALLTLQLAMLATRTRATDEGMAWLDEARQRFAALVPPTHPVFAHLNRASAAFAIQRGDYAQADRDLDAAITAFSGGQTLPIDLAVARAELANLRMRQGRPDQARSLLVQALPVLRANVLPEAVNRVPAERLARQLGGL